MTVCAVMQPTFLPWLGYFDMLDQCDVFVLLDTAPLKRKSWQTRNRIRARDGKQVWLSAPVHARRGDPISKATLLGHDIWQRKHRRSLELAYSHAPHWFFGGWFGVLAPPWLMLANMNEKLIRTIAADLGIGTEIVAASRLDVAREDPYERVAAICEAVGATKLLNTPGARDWLDGHDIGVPVRWHDYTHPVYDQGGAPFMPYLSVVDLLAWHGPDSLDIIRSGRR